MESMKANMKKLKAAIKFGSDIEFSYHDQCYTILPWAEDGIIVGIQGTRKEDIFKDYNDFINNCKVDGKYLKDVLDEVNILLI